MNDERDSEFMQNLAGLASAFIAIGVTRQMWVAAFDCAAESATKEQIENILRESEMH
jgi:hypothetical protein